MWLFHIKRSKSIEANDNGKDGIKPIEIEQSYRFTRSAKFDNLCCDCDDTKRKMRIEAEGSGTIEFGYKINLNINGYFKFDNTIF